MTHFFILLKRHSNTGLNMGQAEYPTFGLALEASGVPRSEWCIDSLSSCRTVEHGEPITYLLWDDYRVED